MKYTEKEMRMLEGPLADRWPAIPDACPREMRARIIDHRAAKLGIKPQPTPDPAADALKARLAVSQQIPVSA